MRPRLVGGAVATVSAVAYGVLALRHHARFEVRSWDLAIFEQAIAGYSRLAAPVVDVKGPGFNILGDHFSPVTALVAPVYRLFPGPRTLLLTQVVLVAWALYVVTALAVRRLGSPLGAVVGVLCATSFGVQSAIDAEFHEVAFAAPLLALAGAAWVERRYTAVAAWSVPLVLVKEDLGITVMVIGALLWWVGERRLGVLTAVAGLVGFVVAVFVVLPGVNDAGAYAYTGNLGGETGLLDTVLAEPGTKLGALVLTFAITGFAALWSRWVLVVVPTFLWRFAGDVPTYWGIEWHYSLVLMPVVFCAAVEAIDRAPRLRWLVPVGVGVSALLLVGSPLRELASPELYRDTPRAAAAREAIALLPPGASVETDIALLSHVVTDHQAYWTGTIGEVTPEYVLFDTRVGIGSPLEPTTWAENVHGGPWTTVYSDEGIVLAKRE
ncbi:MAG: DUF2079 domain-containing protein [Aeromicrobium sp.]|uniref:DUF2079 domain-containing protein n=1 Tax=Aeromicrobium sp. TaxID=1871063 RepID=UPI0025BACACA|nr:DUF2079 domain-containing protein [Aeromicrobium sp.]MDF1703818.1 DUF2079 domain-containing protein [Aeromicrobium sp.]